MLRTRVYSGTAYEVGLARGEALKALPTPHAAPEEVGFARACVEVVGAVFPSALGVFRGIVDASGLVGDDFLAYYFARQEGVLRGCTMFAVTPPALMGDGILVGRNYDWVYSDLKWCEARGIRQDGALPVVGYTHHWAGLPDALNGAGLFAAIASLPRLPRGRPGLQWNIAVDAVMATCRTVREAAEFLTFVVHLRAMSYLLADAAGDAAVVEAGPGGTTVRRANEGLVVATNHEVSGTEAPERRRRSMGRYARVEAALRGYPGGVDEGVVRTVLSDHEGHVCAGFHAGHAEPFHRGEGWGTIWSSICRPDRHSLCVAPGHPCETDYQEVDFRF